MILKILEEVAAKRLERNENNFSIQISSVFMRYAVEEINKNVLPANTQQKQDRMSNEFKYVMFDKEWTIINRAYRDDTNDEDVEHEIYNKVSEVCEKGSK